jgi:hypothetical protein
MQLQKRDVDFESIMVTRCKFIESIDHLVVACSPVLASSLKICIRNGQLSRASPIRIYDVHLRRCVYKPSHYNEHSITVYYETLTRLDVVLCAFKTPT